MPSRTITLRATITLAAPLQRLWPLLSDTDRVNRLVGLPAFERANPDDDLTQIIHSHYFGIPVAWREYPFEWTFEQWFRVERVFAPPIPIERLVTGTHFTPLDDNRTQVDVYVDLVPRTIVGTIAARLVVGRKLLRDLLRVYRSLDQLAITAGEVTPPPARTPVVRAERLNLALERLRQFGIAPVLIERLADHLRTADDPDVTHMRPFALADRWGTPRIDTLQMFLYATRAGLLDLEWDVLCPNCRGPSVRVPTLADLSVDAHCPACNVRYDVNFDESVELRFSVSADVREAHDTPYCIGGPASTRHILAQIWLPAQATKELQLRMEPGTYRLRSRQLPSRAVIEVAEDAEGRAAHPRLAPDDIAMDTGTVAPGQVTLTLENTAEQNVLVILEQSAWSAQAASAALVTALAEFRELFSSEALAPGMGIAIRNLTFMFSDLKGSTMIYEEIGDIRAFARVRDHFAMLRSIIARHHGALIKTIGDAVMAAFPSAEDAVAASLEIQREFVEGEIARGAPPLRVKLGVHRGPCIAVNANGLLDYFGSTVNIAARVQSESLGGDIVLTADMLRDPGVRAVLQQAHPRIETLQRRLKGLSQTFTLFRVWPQGGVNGEAVKQAEAAEEKV
jgi:class 3 adenylate cyclase